MQECLELILPVQVKCLLLIPAQLYMLKSGEGLEKRGGGNLEL
jgi:hypothetical protein